MKLQPPRGADDPQWLELRNALWPDAPEAHLRDMKRSADRGDFVLLAFTEGGDLAGLVEATKRHDYVNGTDTSPVAFVEGVYVRPHWRRRGIARAMVEAAVEWAKREGITELASDAPLSNTVSRAVHRRLGFDETERVIFFRRGLSENSR